MAAGVLVPLMLCVHLSVVLIQGQGFGETQDATGKKTFERPIPCFLEKNFHSLAKAKNTEHRAYDDRLDGTCCYKPPSRNQCCLDVKPDPSGGFKVACKCASTTTCGKHCGEGWTHYAAKSVCLKTVSAKPLSFDDAGTECAKTTGGSLVEPADVDMRDFITGTLLPSTPAVTSAWIGIKDDGGTFKLLNAATDAVAVLDWDDSFPSAVANTNCVKLVKTATGYKMQDVLCTDTTSYICQIPAK